VKFKLLARCPKNTAHKRFVTVAHVTEDWIVDEHGEFLESGGDGVGEVTHPPDPDNTWTCVECGAEAEVTNS
jgi:hypothetical protein